MNMGYVNVILCYALVGISYPIAKDAMATIPTWIFTCTTFLISLFALLPMVRWVDKVKLTRIGLRAWVSISVQSLLGAVLYTTFLLYAFQYSSAISSAIFTSIAPAVVLMLSFFLLKERINSKKLLAIIMAVAGILVLTLPHSGTDGSTSFVGYVFLLLSTLATAGCVIAAKKLDVQLPAITMAAGVCVTGFIFSLPMAVMELPSFDWHVLSVSHYAVLAYYALLVWALPYICFFKGVTRIPASATGMAFSIIPIAATLVSVLCFGESLSILDSVALLLVTGSILFAEAQQDPLVPTAEREFSTP